MAHVVVMAVAEVLPPHRRPATATVAACAATAEPEKLALRDLVAAEEKHQQINIYCILSINSNTEIKGHLLPF